ncbi:MAG: calcium-binding protein [Aulosira sp. ZfuVER01]|nr:calcium-binding protein [Aulosira sp. ZfuVER01]MDZ7997754.1 calcium-binding protein [Aulosira sp. DedVER01a]MDZ8052249.1 calcium-binding protein [Aulosira sp. ZfuCHP01]
MATIRGTSLGEVLNALNPGDELQGLGGDDTLTGLAGNERLFGGDGNDQLFGNDGNDQLFGENGNDQLFGGNGNDQLDGGVGADSMNGGAGIDSYYVDNVGDIITDTDSAAINTYVNFNLSNVLGNPTTLGLYLRTNGITGIGSSRNEVIMSYASNTILKGGDGSDTLKGGSGSKVYGGNGNDYLEITNSQTGTLIGGAGDDVYTIYQVGSLVIDESSDGGSGIDTIFTAVDFSLSSQPSLISQPGVTFIGSGLVENLMLAVLANNSPIKGEGNSVNNVITGNRENNILSGLGGNDTINGSSGNDTIDGGTGADSLIGGIGNDSFTIDNINDIVVENSGEGIDTVTVTTSWATSAEVEFINIISNNTNVNFTLNNSVNATITGNNSYNQLVGGSGNDILAGKGAVDTLTGGLGADIFEFGGTGLSATGTLSTSIREDTITDFQSSQGDKIHLSATTFTALQTSVGSNLAIPQGFISKSYGSSNNGMANENAFFVYNTFNGRLLYNPDGSTPGIAGGGFVATLTGNPSLAATDFLIIA